jgi:hypothetical protein
LDLQRRLAGHNQELCQPTEANWPAMAERESQLEGLRGVIDKVANQQRHEGEKVSGPQEAMGEVQSQVEGVAIKLGEMEAIVERRVGLLERAVLELAETKDRTSRLESDVADLRAAMAEGDVKVEEVRQEVWGLTTELSDCCPKVNQNLTNLERELAKLKEEVRTMSPKPELLAPPGAEIAVPPAQKADAPPRKPSGNSPPPDIIPPPSKSPPVVALQQPAPPKQAKQFPPLVKKSTRKHPDDRDVEIDMPDGIIAHVTRECGGNVQDHNVVRVTCGTFRGEI